MYLLMSLSACGGSNVIRGPIHAHWAAELQVLTDELRNSRDTSPDHRVVSASTTCTCITSSKALLFTDGNVSLIH